MIDFADLRERMRKFASGEINEITGIPCMFIEDFKRGTAIPDDMDTARIKKAVEQLEAEDA